MVGLSGYAQGCGQAVVDIAGVSSELAPTGDAIIRAKAESGSEVLGTGKPGDLGAHFGQKGPSRADANAFDRSQISTKLGKKAFSG